MTPSVARGSVPAISVARPSLAANSVARGSVPAISVARPSVAAMGKGPHHNVSQPVLCPHAVAIRSRVAPGYRPRRANLHFARLEGSA